jgi:hypothetical protein
MSLLLSGHCMASCPAILVGLLLFLLGILAAELHAPAMLLVS